MGKISCRQGNTGRGFCAWAWAPDCFFRASRNVVSSLTTEGGGAVVSEETADVGTRGGDGEGFFDSQSHGGGAANLQEEEPEASSGGFEERHRCGDGGAKEAMEKQHRAECFRGRILVHCTRQNELLKDR
jgi:hypothetical protein